jgi:succinate dehydrogenase / fumarate reductase, flavoprotein subunit
MSVAQVETIMCDVLCIGGGGAAVMAAVTAKEAGADVLIASKGKIGNSGDTIMIGGAYSMDGESAKKKYGFKKADVSVTKDVLFEQIVKQSFHLSEQNLAEQFVEEGPEAVYRCWQWAEHAKVKQQFMKPAGWMLSGSGMGRALRQGLKETPGIRTRDDVMIVDLLKSGNRVCGAVGFDVYSGEPVVFRAKSVVIATGGWQPFSVTSTNGDVTCGDGIAMAYRAGAQLADMEFQLFIPTALEPECSRGSILPYLLTASGLPIGVLDAEGSPIPIPKGLQKIAKGSELGKIITDACWSQPLAEGKGTKSGGLYLDFSRINRMPRLLVNAVFRLLLNQMKQFYRYGYYHSDDLKLWKKLMKERGKLEFALCSEYSMGGIVIDETMTTRVPGLYAAGEAGSGVFGACRVADATTEMLVQGSRAGNSAAQYAAGSVVPSLDGEEVDKILQKIAAPLREGVGINSLESLKKLRSAADEGFGPIRNEAGLSRALAEIRRIREEELPNLHAASRSPVYNYGRMCALGEENLLTCAEAGVRSALMRKESRGFHLRSDFPAVDNSRFASRILVERDGEAMKLSERKPNARRIPIPGGSEPTVCDYIVNQKLV